MVNYSNLIAADDVYLKAKSANMVTSSTLQAGDAVSVDGGINLMMGATITGSSVDFNGTAINFGDIAELFPAISSKLGPDGELMGIKVADLTTLVTSLKPTLKEVNASANLLAAGIVNATGDVTLTGTANAIMASDGAAQVYGENITMTGVDVELTPSTPATDTTEAKPGTLATLAGALLGENSPLSGMLAGMLPTGMGVSEIQDLVIPALEQVKNANGNNILSANLIYGDNAAATTIVGNLTNANYAKTESVTMTALGNVVAGNAAVNGNKVSMTGLANVVGMGASLNGGSTETSLVTLDGMANLIYDGKVTGNTIEMGLNLNDANNPYGGLLSAKDLVSLIPNELPQELAGFDLSKFSGITDLKDELGAFAEAMTGPVNVNVVMGHDALVGGEGTQSVTMDGTANVLISGATVQGNTVTMNGTANMVLGGADVVGTTIEMQGKPLSLDMTKATGTLGDLAGAMLGLDIVKSMLPENLPTGTTNLLSSLVGNVLDDLSVNLVWGGSTHVGDTATGTVTMTALGNVVGQNAVVWANDSVSMTGLANVTLSDGVDNKYAWVHGGNSVTMDGMFNIIYDGKVTTNSTGTISLGISGTNKYAGLLPSATLADLLPDQLPADMGGFDISGITGFLASALPGTVNMNIVMGPNASLTGGAVKMGGVMNMLSDRVQVNATGLVDISGTANIVTDATTIDAGSLSLAGSLNYVGHLTLADVMNAMNGGELTSAGGEPTKLTTTGNMFIWGHANMVHGNAELTSKTGTITMGGMREGEKMMDVETLGTLVGVVEGLLVPGESTGDDGESEPGLMTSVLTSALAELKQQITDYQAGNGTATLPFDELLAGNANLVLDGAKVTAEKDVKMTGTLNMLSGHAEVTAGTNVTMTGMANMVMGGANVFAQNITMTGNGLDLNLGTLANNLLGRLNPTDGTTLPQPLVDILDKTKFSVNLVYGDNTDVGVSGQTQSITMTALGNIVADYAELRAKDVTMNGTANVVMSGAKVYAEGGTITMQGAGKDGLNLGTFITPTAGNENVPGLNKLLTTELSGNLVMGKDTELVADEVRLHGTAMNMIADRVLVDAKDRVDMSGFSNIVTDGTTIQSDGIISMAGTVNFVSHLTLADVMNAAQNNWVLPSADTDSTTTLTAKNSIQLWGQANVVQGGAVLTSTDGEVRLGYKGGSLLGIEALTLDQCAALVKELGLYDVLTDANDTTLGDLLASAGVATGEKADQLLAQAKGMIKDLLTNYNGVNVPTDLLSSNVNAVLDGAKVNAEKGTVTMDGTINAVAGGAQVNGLDVEMTGRNKNPHLGAIGGVLRDSGLLGDLEVPTDMLVELNKLSGSMNLVVDTTSQNVIDAITGNPGAITAGGDTETRIYAKNNIKLDALLNVVSGGKVSLEAGEQVNMIGALNMVGGGKSMDPNIKAKDVNMTGSDAIKLTLSDYLPAEYGALGTVFDKVTEEGVSLNLVAGGAKVVADNDITMTGMVSAVVDTTMNNVMDALENKSIDPILAGGAYDTTLTAGNNIHMDSKLNLVNGGQVALSAGNEVKLEGVMNYVGGNAQVDAKGNVTLTGAANAVLMGADITADRITLKGNPRLTEAMNNLVSSFAPGVNQNVCVSAGVVAGEGTTLTAKSYLHLNDNLNLVAEGAQVSSGTTAHIEGTANVVMTGAAVTGESVLMHGSFGNAVLDAATVTAKTGDISLQAPGLDSKDVKIAGAVADQLQSGILGEALSTLLPDNRYVELLKDNAHYLESAARKMADGGANVVAGGADLSAKNGNIKMEGMANVVMDTTLGNLKDAIETGEVNSLVSGGTDATTLTAGKNIEMSGTFNVVNGGQVKLDAGDDVTLNGSLNVVGGNAQVVKAGQDVNMLGGEAIVVASYLPQAVENQLLPELEKMGISFDLKANASANVVNNGTVTAGRHVNLLADQNTINNATITAEAGDINIGNTTNVRNTTDMSASSLITQQGKVSLTNVDMSMTGGSITAGKGLEAVNTTADISEAILGGTSSIDAMSTVNIQKLVASGATIINMGELSVGLADVTTATASTFSMRAASEEGTLTLNETCLSFGVDTLKSNTTGITLLGNNQVLTLGSAGADAIAGLNFIISAEVMAEVEYNDGFKFILFEDATADDFAVVSGCVEASEITFTVNGQVQDFWRASNVGISMDGTNIVVTGVMIPEPTTATLSLLALAGLAARRRRKN